MMDVFVFELDVLFSKFAGFSFLIETEFQTFTDSDDFADNMSEKAPAAMINLDAVKSEALPTLNRIGCPMMGYYSNVNSEAAKTTTQNGSRYVVA